MGALHQLVPVLLVARLHAPSWGGLTWLLVSTGGLLVVAGFAAGSRPAWLAAGGTLALAGATLLLVNLGATARAARRIDTVAGTVLAAATALWATMALGLLIALSRLVPALAPAFAGVRPLHLTLGLLLAFGLAIVGAGHKLLAMFVLAHGVPLRWLRTAAVAAGLAVLASATAAWLPPELAARPLAGASVAAWLAGLRTVAIATTLASAGLDVRAILARRMRRSFDVGVATYVLGMTLAVPVALLLAAGRPAEAATFALVGPIALAIAGMLVKIVGFLSWQHRYASRIGRDPGHAAAPPTLADMTVSWLARLTAAGLVVAATTLLATRLAATGAPPEPALLAALRSGAGFGAVGAWALVAHLGWIAYGRHRPVVERTPAPVAAAGGGAA
jgi:hypothetical protein